MNKIYNIVWNQSTNQWVVAAELTSNKNTISRSSQSSQQKISTKPLAFSILKTSIVLGALFNGAAAYAGCVSTAYDVATDSRTWSCTGAIPSTYLWSDGSVYSGSGHGIVPSSNSNVTITLESGSSINVAGNTWDGFSDDNPYTGGVHIQNLEIINHGSVKANPERGFNSGSQLNAGTIGKQTYHNYGLYQGHEAGVNPGGPLGLTFNNYSGAIVIGGLGMKIGSGAGATTLLNNSGTITGQWMNHTDPAQQVGPVGSWHNIAMRKPDHAIAVSLTGQEVIFNQQDGIINGDITFGGSTNTFNVSGGTINGDVFYTDVLDNSATGYATPGTFNLSNGQVNGDIYMLAGADTFTTSGGAVAGSIFMGNDDDTAIFTNQADISNTPQMDGGLGNDALNIDSFSIRGFTASSNDATGNDQTKGNNLTGWEIINVKNAGTLKLSNNLFTAANVGTLNIDASSTLDLKGNSPGVFTIYGDVNNSGMMTMADGSADDVTTITGNYTGVAGSQYNIDTVLGNDASATDKLIVNGNTAGTTTLSVTNVGGAGAQTVEGIQVVQVDGNSAGTFSLASPVQASAYEYQLFQGGTSTPTDGDWYLRSHLTTVDCKVTNTCTPIYRPGVAGYVAAQTANAHQGFDQLGTLHERMGEQRHVTADGKQTWGRIYHREESNNDGHDRFSYDQNSTGFQIGQDLWVKRDNQAQKHAGVSLSYVHSNADFSDSVRPLAGLEAGTGSMSADSIGIGGYYTHMGDDGRYLDVVGQISHLRNKFTDSYAGKATQTGWRAGLSAEVGKPVAEYKGWKFEPQAQLSYQYTDYGSFNDAISKVDGYDAHTLRGRVGLRVHKDANYGTDRQAQYYAIGNVIHDFIKPEAVTIGNTTVRENFDRTYWELGAGIQGQVAKNTYVYADARYQQSFQNNQHAGKVNIGIKTKF